MQKKIIALAVAGLVSGAAFAQSNVTIYGVADATMDSVSATGATAGSAAGYANRMRMVSNSSYIGFKGTEDLGGGMKAVFQLENGVNFDNSAAGVWNNRDSYVGVAGGFGTVVAGNLTTPTRLFGAKMDVNTGATGIGANTALLGKAGGGAGASAFDQRATNALAYISPTWSGFHFAAGYSTGIQNPVNTVTLSGKEASAAGSSAKGNTAWTVGLVYDNGPLFLAFADTTVNTTNNGAAAADGLLGAFSKANDMRAAANYNFGMGTVGLLWDRPKYSLVAGGDAHTTIWYLPVTFNMGNGKVIAQYGHAGNVNNTTNTSANHFVLGYEYNMSKRTVLKAVYSAISNKSAADYDFLYGVSASATTATNTSTGAAPGAGAAGADPRGISVGIRHSF